MLIRMSSVIDSNLRKEQAVFRKGKLCGDQIFFLTLILEQINEWNTTMYVNSLILPNTFDNPIWDVTVSTAAL